MIQGTKISQDLALERKINAFLRDVVFPCLASTKKINIMWLNKENLLDMRGVDIMIDGFFVDIKSHRTKDALTPQRYSFELQTRHRTGDGISDVTEVYDGWLMSKKKITEKYLFCYYDVDSENSIVFMSLSLIDKRALFEMLEEKGIPISGPVSKLRAMSNKVVVQPNGSVKFYFPNTWGISLTHSLQLPEQPLNIVIKSQLLKEICDWIYTFKIPIGVQNNNSVLLNGSSALHI